jgi:hypothetical protein
MRIILILVTAVFTAYTGLVLLEVGYLGFYRQLLATPSGWQALVDISIALLLVLSWLRRDARLSGRVFWPYLALTLALGSLGPLLYLVLRPQAGAVGAGHS